MINNMTFVVVVSRLPLFSLPPTFFLRYYHFPHLFHSLRFPLPPRSSLLHLPISSGHRSPRPLIVAMLLSTTLVMAQGSKLELLNVAQSFDDGFMFVAICEVAGGTVQWKVSTVDAGSYTNYLSYVEVDSGRVVFFTYQVARRLINGTVFSISLLVFPSQDLRNRTIECSGKTEQSVTYYRELGYNDSKVLNDGNVEMILFLKDATPVPGVLINAFITRTSSAGYSSHVWSVNGNSSGAFDSNTSLSDMAEIRLCQDDPSFTCSVSLPFVNRDPELVSMLIDSRRDGCNVLNVTVNTSVGSISYPFPEAPKTSANTEGGERLSTTPGTSPGMSNADSLI